MSHRIIDFIAIVILLVLILSGFLWAYNTPYRLNALYAAKDQPHEMDILSEDDFRVYSVSRLGKVERVEDFRLNSDEVSKTGLVAITSENPKLGTLVDLNSISVASSEILYNDYCREDEVDLYKPKVEELIEYADGTFTRNKEKNLDVTYTVNKKEHTISLTVEGLYDTYAETFAMVTADRITTDTKISTKKRLTSDKLDLLLHYSDGSEKRLSKKMVRCEDITKPKVGVNTLTCYYDDKKYDVKVVGYEPEDKRPKVTFADYGTFILEYSKPYEVPGVSRLNTWVGVRYFNNHRETYYSCHEDGGFGTNLYIPGKHVAEDGTIRDGEGYICVAADYRFCHPHQVVLTTLGPGKVYDTGCVYGTIDVYVDW